MMSNSDYNTRTRLADEARFADTAYLRFADQTRLNLDFYAKYATPKHDWDWREWGAKRLGSVRGCRVLDLGCGAGEEAVYLAKMGADVTAIDISTVGVRLTKERARANDVADRVTATVMTCDPTDFESETFDVVHGFGILHHIGLRRGLLEVRRVLKTRGRGLFFEHMGNSPLIESLRPKEGRYTENERPVRWNEIKEMSSAFSRFEAEPFHILTRLKRLTPFFGRPAIRRFDRAVLSAMPFLRYFASGVVIYLEK